ncbi:Lsr2 family protein [Cellulomonas sp. PS-H5]|nr:Lsr2 family protein [Cellulomonas sp. PS-H5]
MSKRLLVSVVDDLDGTPAGSSHVLGLDDQRVRLDLSAANLTRLRTALAPFVDSDSTPDRGRSSRASTPRAWRRWPGSTGHRGTGASPPPFWSSGATWSTPTPVPRR